MKATFISYKKELTSLDYLLKEIYKLRLGDKILSLIA